MRLLTKKDPEALAVMRHSAAQSWPAPSMRLHKGVQLAFGPTIENGFYYDIESEHKLSEEDFPAIEAEMARSSRPTSRSSASKSPRETALAVCRDLGQSLKVEHIETGLAEEKTLKLSIVKASSSTCAVARMCPVPARSAHFKLLSVAGAYWKGDSSRQQLQRLYATAWFSKEELEAHLKMVEEAKNATTACSASNWNFSPSAIWSGPGWCCGCPKGPSFAGCWNRSFATSCSAAATSRSTRRTSAKWNCTRSPATIPYYADSQFKPIEMEDDEQYLLKPMNCPHHIMIYQSKPRSYRDLPVRLAEFGTVYRYEKSGELGGMTRVRGFTQDDAHLFCTEEQVADEFRGCMEMTQYHAEDARAERLPRAAGIPRSQEPKYVGNGESWDRAEKALEEVCHSLGIDAKPRGGRGRLLWPQGRLCGQRLHRPRVAIWHRASGLQPAERRAIRAGIYRRRQHAASAGDDPPRAAGIDGAVYRRADRAFRRGLSAVAGAGAGARADRAARSRRKGRKAEAALKGAGFRVTGDYRSEKLGAKIRDAQLKLVPYMFVVGERDAGARDGQRPRPDRGGPGGRWPGSGASKS